MLCYHLQNLFCSVVRGVLAWGFFVLIPFRAMLQSRYWISCLVTWPESSWPIMIPTERISLALLTLGTWWQENVDLEAMSIHFSQFYNLCCKQGLRVATAGCGMWSTDQNISNYSVLEGIPLTRSCSSLDYFTSLVFFLDEFLCDVGARKQQITMKCRYYKV